MDIAISRLHFPVTTLGPGKRIGIWFQGCRIRCRGCISADTWAEGKDLTQIANVIEAITPWLADADGITVSGGEPFDQPQALGALLEAMPLAHKHDVLVYSGYAYEQLAGQAALSGGRIDALISGPFVADAPQTLPLRGSDNQRLHLLTECGRHRFARYLQPAGGLERSLDVMFDEDGTVWLAGIPRPGDMQRLRTILKGEGHAIQITAASN